MIVGERIKQKRLENGWTQPELAERMGYNKSSMLRIERGEVDLPQSRIEQFARVLGTTPGHLMGWDDIEPENAGATAAKVLKDINLFRLVTDYLKMDEADQYNLRLIAKSFVEKQKKD